MKFRIKAKNRKRIIRLGKILSLSLAFFVLAYIIYSFAYLGKVPPNSYLVGQKLGAKSRADVQQVISESVDNFSQNKITFYAGEKQFSAPLDDLGISYDKMATARAVFNHSGNGGFFKNQLERTRAIIFRRNVEPVFSVDTAKFNDFLDAEFAPVERPSENSMVAFDKSGPRIMPSKNGVIVDRVMLVGDLNRKLRYFSVSPIALNYAEDLAQVDANGAIDALNVAKDLAGKTIILTYKYDRWPISGQKFFDLLKFEAAVGQTTKNLQLGQTPISVKVANEKGGDQKLKVALDEVKVDELIAEIAKSIDQPTMNATLVFDGTKVTNFTPAQDGLALDRGKTKKLLLEKILASEPSKQATVAIELPVGVTHAKIANSEVNKLGIVELLGSGISYFAGSIPNRIFNIGLGASLISGTIVPPGDVFSFDTIVGPVSAAQGFKQGYIINKGHTVLDDGGGICQVSTTTFRAVLNAGLPVVKRTAHAYRVGYYEQHGFKPGFDATIFSPSVDFQFKNDTDHHILVQARVDTENAKIEVDIYGTADGRRVQISDPVITNVKPAPPPLYQDDPSLPRGTTKQVDFTAIGANVVFGRKVWRGDQLIIDDTFRSNFRPWQAVYLVGTGG